MSSAPEVTIEQGVLKGKIAKDYNSKEFYSFQGIPYAKPPIGPLLRFKAPEPAEKWVGTFDATKEGDASYSPHVYEQNRIIGSENCLVLNVFTKNLPAKPDTLHPVMFYIHGGGFTLGSGSSTEYGPEFLLTEDVVLVTINYRLGIFGFLTLDDKTTNGVTGNAGFKDMVMALKWVQANIAQFGGDPNNVTIFGQSAGGCATHALILSPMAKGLFHKAIALSGCTLTPWAKGYTHTKKLLEIFGYQEENSANEYAVYKKLQLFKTKEELLEIQEAITDYIIACENRPFGLVVDKNAKEPFMPDEPINLIMSGNYNKVPLMTGYTTAEGICFDLFKNPKNTKLGTESNIPWELGYEYGTEQSKAIANKIDKFYKEEQRDATNSTRVTTVLTDSMFLYPAYVMASKHALDIPVYFYQVSIESELNFFKKMVKSAENGVSHGDELGYLFTSTFTPKIKKGSVEEQGMLRFVKLWTNFAKYGQPTPEKDALLGQVNWTPLKSATSFSLLDIGEKLTLLNDPVKERVQFWNDLYKNSLTPSTITIQ